MKIAVINGTEVRGCTYQIKESFLAGLRLGNDVKEFFLPKDLPYFCCGCKRCFFKSEQSCPHARYVSPIWNAILAADLLVFASPVYALRTTAQMKALLDHLCVHWMVHRPDERMFSKRAVILTNAVGVFHGGAQRDIATSLLWLGVSDVKKMGVGLLEGVVWNDLSEQRRRQIVHRARLLSAKYVKVAPAQRGALVTSKFLMCKVMHQSAAKNEKTLSADNRHWLEKGWIKPLSNAEK